MNFRSTYILLCALVLLRQVGTAYSYPGHSDFIVTLRKPFRNDRTVREMTEQYGFVAKHTLPGHGMVALRMPGGMSSATARGMLESDSRVARAEPDFVVRAADLPDDSLFHRQWGLYNPAGGRADIKAPEAWQVCKGSRKVVVAILDTGFDFDHPDLLDNLWTNPGEIPGNGRDDDANGFVDDTRGWNFCGNTNRPVDGHYHGTLMAGIAGAATNNGRGVAGVMHHVSLMAVKGLGDDGYGYTSDLAAGIYYAVDNGAKIINASWGGGGYLEAMRDAIRYAARHDVVFVAAAGNWVRDNDRTPFYPASYPDDNIISVAAGDRNDSLADFSHWGAVSVDLVAPGVDVISTTIGGGYFSAKGTSLSAPHVTGVVGLLCSYVPGLSYREYVRYVLDAAERLPHLAGTCVTSGRLDAYRALRNATPRRTDARLATYYVMKHRVGH